MPFRPPSGSEPAQPNLFGSVRHFWRVILGSFHTRLELLTTELEDEAVRLAYIVGAGLFGLVALHGALLFALIWILAAVWDTPYRLWVIGGIFLLYLAAAAASLFYAWSLVASRPKFLSQTMEELKHDVEGFKIATAAPEGNS